VTGQGGVKIGATFRLPDQARRLLDELGEVIGPDGWRQALGELDALVTDLTTRIDADAVRSAPRLRVVSQAAAGVDNLDIATLRERGVAVTNTPDALTEATADIAMGLIVSTMRRFPQAEASLRAGEFRGWDYWGYLGRDIAGATLGIFGMGRIGRALARRARAFGMRIIYHNRSPVTPEVEAELDARLVTLDELVESSDVLSLHAPLSPQTRHTFDAAMLRRMKRGSFLINTGRGPLVDEGALVELLRSGHLAGAGLDVYEREPEVHPELLELDNVTLLPHIGSATVETRERMAVLAAENVRAVLAGEPPLTPVG
jgi:glyoxylate reductase